LAQFALDEGGFVPAGPASLGRSSTFAALAPAIVSELQLNRLPARRHNDRPCPGHPSAPYRNFCVPNFRDDTGGRRI